MSPSILSPLPPKPKRLIHCEEGLRRREDVLFLCMCSFATLGWNVLSACQGCRKSRCSILICCAFIKCQRVLRAKELGGIQEL